MVTPIIRLELTGLNYQVHHALLMHQAEIAGTVKAELQRTLDNFDFRAVVEAEAKRAVQETVARAVKEYFGYGGEGGKQIEAMVKAILTKEATDATDR